MNSTEHAADVTRHYSRHGLLEKILAALESTGKTPPYSVDDLAPVDHFHIGGKAATEGLIRLAQFTAETRVLDVGGGLGGPARTLAREVGCPVAVLDLTPEFCRAATELTRLAGLDHLVTVREGNALAMPFDDGAFDAAWTQHSAMNIEDKPALYREIRRVVRPGGTLAVHEVVAGTRGPLEFPVPWARGRAISFLVRFDEMREILSREGFHERAWEDVSAAAIYWWRARQPPVLTKSIPLPPPPPLGLHLLLGSDAAEMAKNTLRNLEEDHIRVVRAIYTRR